MTIQLTTPNNMTVDELMKYGHYVEAALKMDAELDFLDISWADISGIISERDNFEKDAEYYYHEKEAEKERADGLDDIMQSVQSLLNDVEHELKLLKADGAEVELEANLEHLQSVICNSKHTGDWSWQA